jgi:hypothetical protein
MNPKLQFDQETLSRIKRARAAGVNPAQIEQEAMEYQMRKNTKGQMDTQNFMMNNTREGQAGIPKPGGGNKGFQATDLLPMAGGVVGGLLGAPLGGIGAIGGGAAGAAGGEWLRQQITPEEDNDMGKIATEGAWGLAGGVGGRVLGKGAQLASKFLPKAANSLAAKEIAAAFTVPGKAGARLNVEDAAQRIINHGGEIPLTLKATRNLAGAFTGDKGISTVIERAYLPKIKTPIQYAHALTGATQYMQQNGVNAKDLKDAMNTARAIIGDPTKGIGSIDAEKGMDIVRKLEKIGYKWLRDGDNPYSPNSVLMAKGEGMIGIADDLKGQIGRALDLEGYFPKMQSELLDAIRRDSRFGPGLFNEVAKTRTYADYRNVSSPYTRLDQAAKLTMNNQQAPFNQASGQIGANILGAGAGGLMGGPVGMAAGVAAAPIIQATAQAAKMPILATTAKGIRAAGKLPNTGGVLPAVAGQSAAQGMDALTSSGQPSAMDEQSMIDGFPTAEGAGMESAIPQPLMTREQAFMLMAANPKQISAIKALYEMGQPGKDDKVSVTGAQRQALAKSGLRNLQILKKELDNDPSVVLKQAVPGKFFSRQFDSSLFRTVEALLRLRTGAAAPEQEVKRYMDQWGPRLGDNAEVVQSKLDALEQDLYEAYQSAFQMKEEIPLPSNGLSGF